MGVQTPPLSCALNPPVARPRCSVFPQQPYDRARRPRRDAHMGLEALHGAQTPHSEPPAACVRRTPFPITYTSTAATEPVSVAAFVLLLVALPLVTFVVTGWLPRTDPPERDHSGFTVVSQRREGYLVDPASSICLSQRLSHASLSTHGRYSETANGSLNQLWFL